MSNAGVTIDGYWYHMPEEIMLVPSVEPAFLPRPGAYGTFGTGIVGPILIAGTMGYTGALSPEAAFLNLFKRLNPANTAPRQLRAVRNDNVAISTMAVLQIPAASDSKELNVKPVWFQIAEPIWQAVGYTTGSGGFT